MKLSFIERFAPAFLIVSCALFFFIAFRSQFSVLREKDPTKVHVYEDQINDRGKKLLKDARLVEGSYKFDNRGLLLAAGQSFRIVHTFTKEPSQDIWLEMRFFSNPYVSNRIVVARPDEERGLILAENQSFLEGMPEDSSLYLRGAKEFAIILSAKAKPDCPEPMLILDSIRVIFADRVLLPSLPLFVSIIAALLLLWHWLNSFVRSSIVSRLLICEAILIALMILVRFVLIPSYLTLLIFIPFGLLLLQRWLRTKDSALARRCVLFAFLFILWVGTFLRWQLFMIRQNAPAEPDCGVYLSLASKLPSLFDTEFREPLFIWAIKVFTSLTAPNSLNLRLMTVLLSIVCIIATFEVGRRLLGNAAALLGSLGMAISPTMMFSAQRGLRLELIILTVLPFFYFAMRKSAKRSTSEISEVGSWAGLNYLNVLSSYLFAIPLILYKAIRDRFRWWTAALAILLSLVIASPHLIHNKKQFGDPLYSVNIHAKYYRNREFAGQPGFPTVYEVIENGYTGSPTTTFAYVFGLHSLPDILISSVKGWWAIYFGKFVCWHLLPHFLLFTVYVAGILFLLLEPRRDLLLGYFLLAASLFFVAGKMPELVPPRLAFHIAPLTFLITGYGIVRIIALAVSLSQRVKRTAKGKTRHPVKRRKRK